MRASLNDSTYTDLQKFEHPEYKKSLKKAIRDHYKTPISKKPKR